MNAADYSRLDSIALDEAVALALGFKIVERNTEYHWTRVRYPDSPGQRVVAFADMPRWSKSLDLALGLIDGYSYRLDREPDSHEAQVYMDCRCLVIGEDRFSLARAVCVAALLLYDRGYTIFWRSHAARKFPAPDSTP